MVKDRIRSRVFCDAVNAVGFKNVILFKDTRVNLISIRYIENERPSLNKFSPKSLMQISYTNFTPPQPPPPDKK
jgi:hypothetical protein